ncbi:MAG: hypothetical protein J2P18_20695 [Nocardia sp.]|nr:hypothetical protein [Nocardia sp.]
MASYMSTMNTGFGGVEVEYEPPSRTDSGYALDAGVLVRLRTDVGTASMGLSIEDARVLAEQLPQIVMMHDAAVRLAAEKAVA